MNNIDIKDCIEMDRRDILSSRREDFHLNPDVLYFNGNSLGAPPRAARQRALQVIDEEWGTGLSRSWNAAGWIRLPQRLGKKIAALTGAQSDEVICADNTSIAIYKALAMALQLNPGRSRVLVDAKNFPTDNYILQGLVALLGNSHEIVYAEIQDFPAHIDDSIGIVFFSHVDYKTARINDVPELTRLAHDAGAIVVCDLCHSAGVMEVALDNWQVDLAVGCTYKYLHGGPGSPAFTFVAKRLHDRVRQPITGWWGHAEPFLFEMKYRPAAGLDQTLTGTQHILSMAVAEAGIDSILKSDISLIREKSKALTTLYMHLMSQRCGDFAFTTVSPAESGIRGSHVSYEHENAYEIVKCLLENGLVADYREPHLFRMGFSPLTTRFVDVWNSVSLIEDVMRSGAWMDLRFSAKSFVT